MCEKERERKRKRESENKFFNAALSFCAHFLTSWEKLKGKNGTLKGGNFLWKWFES